MHISNNYASPVVVKYGGNAMGPEVEQALLSEVVGLQRGGTPVVLVHGGGPEIDRWLAGRGVQTRRVDGLRVTDDATLEVTEAVLCATINKRIVRACCALGARAVGVSGEDAAMLRARRAYGSGGEDLGYVGEVTACDPSLLETLLGNGYLPVVAPLAVGEDSTHALNVNADLAAAAIAGALRASAFVIGTNVPRVLRDPRDPASGIDKMTLDEARAFLENPACSGGMQPKIRSAVAAVEGGAGRACICAVGESTIAQALDETTGTVIAATFGRSTGGTPPNHRDR